MLKYLLCFLSCWAAGSGALAQDLSAYVRRISHPEQVKNAPPAFDPGLKPFYHGVASGDPTAESVVIWTRVTPDSGQTSISGAYFVATDTAFTNIQQSGLFTAEAARDYTVHITLHNLTPGAVYYYYFRALGANSLIGRARTCPQGPSEQLRFAVVSCSNYEGGYFNAYDMISRRNDLDAVIHLGDYIYEYGAGTYGIPLPDRTNDPAYEILTLADYRTRYSLYRLDADLRRLHQQHTMISVWDDHESANDSYNAGAQNHQPDEGSWAQRKAISRQTYFEWMPIRSNGPDTTVYRSVSYGDLCEWLLLDTRLEGRVAPPPHFDTPDVPARNMISPAQYAWLCQHLKNSPARWILVGNQVLFSTTNVGFAGGPFDLQPDPFNIDSIRIAEDLFIDNWESYPTQRNALIDTLAQHDIDNVVILTGDSHCSWAFDVTKEPVKYPLAQFLNLPQPNPYNAATGIGYDPASGAGSWAVEFGTPSVSSPNFDEIVGPTLAQQFSSVINQPLPVLGNYNPHLKYVDLLRHGYILLQVRPDTVQSDYYYVPTVAQDSSGEAFAKAAFSVLGSRRVQTGNQPAPPGPWQAAPAPLHPLATSSAASDMVLTITACYPNPVQDWVFLQSGVARPAQLYWRICDAQGRVMRQQSGPAIMSAGVYQVAISMEGLPAGVYFLQAMEQGRLLAAQRLVKE